MTNSSQAFGLKDVPMMRPGEFIQMDDGTAAGKEVNFDKRINQTRDFSHYDHKDICQQDHTVRAEQKLDFIDRRKLD